MHEYIIHYNDGLYSVPFKFSDSDYEKLSSAILEGDRAIIIPEIGVFVLEDIRTIVQYEVLSEKERSFTPDLTEEEQAYVDLLKNAERYAESFEDDDTEFSGGVIG